MALLEGGDGSRLSLSFEIQERGVAMEGHTGRSPDGFEGERLDISRQILDAVCDENDLVPDGDDIRVRILMRRA